MRAMTHALVVLVLSLAAVAAQAKAAAKCQPKATIDVKAGGVRALTWLPGGKTLWTANEDGSIHVVDVKKSKDLKTLKGHSMAAYAISLSADGKLAATGAEDKKVMVWDVKGEKSKHVLSGHQNTVRSVAFTPDGKMLLTASLDRQLGRWDVDAGKLDQMLGGQACILMGVAVGKGKLKDGAPFAGTACNDGLVRVWNLRTGKSQLALEGHEGEVRAVAFAPAEGDNPPMATGDNESKVIIWDIAGKSARLTMENAGWTDALAFSPDGKVLVSAGNDMASKGLFKVWDAANGKLLNEQFPHDGNIAALGFSPDGKTLATGSMDETVKLWDVAQLIKGCDK